MKLAHTRKMISEALSGHLDHVEYNEETVFGLSIPSKITSIPTDILNPRNTWSDKEAYDNKANQPADMFTENFKQFKKQATEDIVEAGSV